MTQSPDTSPIPRPPSSIPEARIPPTKVTKVQQPSPSWQTDSGDPNIVLRHRLDQLDYHEPFTQDSAALIQHLLADLIQTTETARRFKSQYESTVQEKNMADEQVAPLRNEILRLTQESNELHAQLIQLTDERDIKDRRAQQAARKLEAQTADLRFMASQYAKRVESEQKKADEARDRAEEIMGKLGLFQQSKNTKGKAASAEKMFQKLQKIDIETGLGNSIELIFRATGANSYLFRLA